MEPTVEYKMATVARADTWVPACGGHETPVTYSNGRTALYVWNPARGEHRYLDMKTDILLSRKEERELFR